MNVLMLLAQGAMNMADSQPGADSGQRSRDEYA